MVSCASPSRLCQCLERHHFCRADRSGEARLEDIAGLSSDVIGGFKFNQFAELSAEAVYDFKLDWFDA